MSKINFATLTSALVSVFFLALASNVEASDFRSPRTVALGGAAHAGPLLNDALYLNPSYASFLPSYSMSANYVKHKSPDAEATRGHQMNLSIQDGRNEIFQAGAGYTRREDAAFFHLGASKSFVQSFGLGVSGKFFFINTPGTDKAIRGSDTTFSTTYVYADWFYTSVIVDNISQTAEGKSLGLYREFIFGTKFNIEQLLLVYFDPHWVPEEPTGKKYGYEGGIEIPLAKDFFIRAGQYRASNDTYQFGRGNGWGAGFGWIAPRVSLDYAFGRSITPSARQVHTLGMTVFF